MQRRELMKLGAVATVATIIGGGSIACGVKLTTWVATITGALDELKPLLPAQAALLAKIAKVATDFNDAYQSGKFASASTIFENLSGLIDQLVNDIGTPSQQVKIIIALVGVAVRTIAVILKSQATPTIASAATAVNASAVSTIERLSASDEVDALFRAVKHP